MKIDDLKKLRNEYRIGSRIKLIMIEDEYVEIKPGICGTVKFIDDIGTIHVLWDNGLRLGIIPNVDKFEKID